MFSMKEDMQTIKDVAKLQQSYDFISDTLKEQNIMLKEILHQATRTNGRLLTLEEWKLTIKDNTDEFRTHRRWLVGVLLTFMSIFGGAVYAITKTTLNNHIDRQVGIALQIHMQKMQP